MRHLVEQIESFIMAQSDSLFASHIIISDTLVKNSFLKNERTFLRKIVEMILALALEGTISKMEILSAYLCKIYWGHGIYGIQSASEFYFGKHISLLILGECAMLAAMIPAPELRSPFRDSSRGKIFEARVLKRMVVFGFLDVEMASIAVKQPLRFNSGNPDHSDGFLVISSSSQESVTEVYSQASREFGTGKQKAKSGK